MKKKYWTIVFCGIIILFFLSYINHRSSPTQKASSLATQSQPSANSLSLITEPEDGIAPILTMIKDASTSVDLVMYELEDPQIEATLAADKKRGVAVRVILSNGYKSTTSSANEPAYEFLVSHDVPVQWSPDYFTFTHQKTLIIDGAQAVIMTLNVTKQYYDSSRDFGIIDRDQKDIKAIEATFNNDWRNNNVTPDDGDDLVWSPGSRNALLSIIENAKTLLDIYNEEMADTQIENALIDAARRGVEVQVAMTYSPSWQSDFEKISAGGVHVRIYPAHAGIYIHAKMILADDNRAFMGSENFSDTSLNENRELGIVFTNNMIISSLTKTFTEDWNAATPF